MAEPAIIEHHELDAERFRAVDEGKELLFIEIEERRFPVIDEHGPHAVAPVAAAEVLAEEMMERTRHHTEPFTAVDKHCLRRLERLPRRDLPRKIKRIQPDGHARDVELVRFGKCLERAAIDEAHGIHLAMPFLRAG